MTEAYSASLPAETIRDSTLYNKDLAPISTDRRTWRTYNYAALWISMSVNIPTYMLASGMIAGGMNWKQALFTVFLGNVLVLIPMLLNAHAGARYGIPFPVFARASFGVLGANVPAILRALVACGWFGIQTWIGGEAINAMIVALVPAWAHFAYGAALCFGFFWLLNVLVILRGIETIRFLQGISAPFLLLIGLALLAVGSLQGWRIRPHALDAFKISELRRILPVLCSGAYRRGRVLGHGLAEHPGFHALRAEPARPSPWAGSWPSGHDDVLLLHRNRGHLRDADHFRAGALESGRGAVAVRQSVSRWCWRCLRC